jgi:hypothetical protein
MKFIFSSRDSGGKFGSDSTSRRQASGRKGSSKGKHALQLHSRTPNGVKVTVSLLEELTLKYGTEYDAYI